MTRRTGSARSGLGEWLLQRITALYMAGFGLVAAAYLLAAPPVADYAQWQAWLAGGIERISLVLFFVSALVHAWIGLRSIYMDYLRPVWLRFSVLVLTLLALLTQGIWVGNILLWGFRP